MQFKTFAEVLISITRIRAGEFDYDQAQHCAHTGRTHSLSHNTGKEVHIIETGDASAQHLGQCQLRPCTDILSADPACLGRPDVIVEPGHQGQIVSHATHQTH